LYINELSNVCVNNMFLIDEPCHLTDLLGD